MDILDIAEQLEPALRQELEKQYASLQGSKETVAQLLLAILRDAQRPIKVRQNAGWALRQFDVPSTVPGLGAVLTDSDAHIRKAAIDVLGPLGDKRAAPALIRRLRTETDPDLRHVTVFALGMTGSKRATLPLIGVMQDGQELPHIRGQAAESLVEAKDKRAIDPLIAALDDPCPDVRFWSAYALGQLGVSRALPVLKRLAATDKAWIPRWGRVCDEARRAIEVVRERDA